MLEKHKNKVDFYFSDHSYYRGVYAINFFSNSVAFMHDEKFFVMHDIDSTILNKLSFRIELRTGYRHTCGSRHPITIEISMYLYDEYGKKTKANYDSSTEKLFNFFDEINIYEAVNNYMDKLIDLGIKDIENKKEDLKESINKIEQDYNLRLKEFYDISKKLSNYDER